MRLDYYYFPWSHWSRVCSLVLAEKGLFEDAARHIVDIRTNANYAPAYMALNPRGVVPTVVIDGVPVCNTPDIVRALDAIAEPIAHPDEADVHAWAARLEALKLMHLSYHVWTKGERGEKSADILDDKVQRSARMIREQPNLASLYSRKRDFFAQFRAEVYDPDHRDGVRAETRSLLEDLAEQVSDRAWIAGDHWSWPDALAASVLWRLQDLDSGLDVWRDDPDHPLARYFARLKGRPSFAAVFFDDKKFKEL